MMLFRRIFAPWFAGLLLLLLVLLAILFNAPSLRRLDYPLLDALSRYRSIPAGGQVAVVAIDRDSLAELGDWPWPRSVLARLVERLTAQKVRAIGIYLPLTYPEAVPALERIRELKKQAQSPEAPVIFAVQAGLTAPLDQLEADFHGDAALARALTDGKVVLPVLCEFSAKEARMAIPLADSPPWTLAAPDMTMDLPALLGALRHPFAAMAYPLPRPTAIIPPFTPLASAAAALGHSLVLPDEDGSIRKTALFVAVGDRFVPSLPLSLAAVSLGVSPSNWKIVDDRRDFFGLELNSVRIPTDPGFRLLLHPDPTENAVAVFSAARLLAGDISPGTLQGKTVLIGLSAPETATLFSGPGGWQPPPVHVGARTVATILAGAALAVPPWGWGLEVAVLLYFGFFLLFVLPRISLRMGAVILAIFLATWYALSSALLVSLGYWVSPLSATCFAVAGFALLGFFRWLAVARERSEKTITNKLQGVAFQGQGMLDLALEKFMACPPHDASVRELLYHLGLDFERKRMFSKAVTVYEQLARQGKFRDVAARLAKLRQGASPVSFAANGRQESTLVLDPGAITPTLGRYEVLRELGQGAMGTVYLGRDPRINREVAIKTLSYAAIEPEKLGEVKERFFREAEAAGRLNHPNIVTIYDVGEDHDMAYMAMELLEGGDLSRHCQQGRLLGPAEVLRIVSKVAAALEYAHEHEVVHRDIKPGNIMLTTSGQVKVTDFGIARLVPNSRTQTGVILGTPSYMSPEQVAGKKVDGRSDLFSLGVVLYELLSGEKPFQGDSLGALMFAIANATYTPLREIAPDVPECCLPIVEKLLAKTQTRRYAKAGQVLKDLQACLRETG
ncbi:MAG: CHASE2 domain-containing serine/threonine-protein kinase [Desulfuromonadales bacterium]|uniref:CHASE2 domain-containing serine/threonine-protein kinase n=1 Tax=Desulfuromonas sp. KJ2020 TaxID=2919173 RepID=UPI0020A75052|nr:serine/threonine-protein kinase [Desulfuromonas sp. KJ2020]MCP3177236.1 serine/threonine-protein kinase [Desulfuromonas sp. KJ2020]